MSAIRYATELSETDIYDDGIDIESEETENESISDDDDFEEEEVGDDDYDSCEEENIK